MPTSLQSIFRSCQVHLVSPLWRPFGSVPAPGTGVAGSRPIRHRYTSSQNVRKPTMTNLSGKTALVTGASRGIGAAIAKRLAADGARVAITYTKGAEAAAEVVKAIVSAGGKAIAIQADATDPAAVKAAIEKTVSSLGRLDVLVNNAGTAI